MKRTMTNSNSMIAIILALSTTLFFTSCGGGDNNKVEVEKEIVEEVEEFEGIGDEHEGHDHGGQAEHDHAEDMEAMDTKGTDLSFEKGSWAYDLQQAMESDASETFILDKIPFEGEELSDEASQQLDDLAALLKSHPNARIVIKAHTKEAKNAVGRQAKKATSKARALWVQTKLSLRGATGDQMRARGMADEELLEGVPSDDDSQSRITITLGTQE